MSTNESAKEQAMELAEDARNVDYEHPSFTAELFKGNFRWDLIHPFPQQDEADRKAGDEFMEKLRHVLETYVDPIEIDRSGEYPQEALDKLAEIGAFGMKIAKEYGGLGFSQMNYSRALSIMGSYCQSTVTWVSAHQSIGVPQPLKLFGTPEQKQKYLPRMAAGDVSAFALTEPNVGSDPAKMEATAELSEDGEHYILNGTKLWCTNGPSAKLLVVMAKTPPKIVNGKERTQISAFVVETEWEGVEVEFVCDFMGLRGISNGQLAFKNVKVPKDNIIGKEGMGLRIALSTLNVGRLGIPAASGGAAKLGVKSVAKWARDRVQWGQSVGKHQSISKKISNMATDTFAMESVVWLASGMTDLPNFDIRLEAAIAKYFCTETAWKICDDYVQVRGGRGYETAHSLWRRGDTPIPIERGMRDARIGRIFEGSSEVMHLILAREAMDTHFKLVMPLLMPKPGSKDSKVGLILNAAKFYAGWYPGLYFPKGGDYKVQHLNNSCRDHLSYIERNCRKMARTIFHTMGKYQQKLEYEQVLLNNFVDIGTDIFVMAATLAYAESWMEKNGGKDDTPLLLADVWCRDARERIEQNFRRIRKNHNALYGKVANAVMDEKLDWLYTDIMEDLPPKYRTPPENVKVSIGSEVHEEAGEPVAK
jgi:alkylation response protein AidB-like acyl-CoA dehydrogenase